MGGCLNKIDPTEHEISQQKETYNQAEPKVRHKSINSLKTDRNDSSYNHYSDSPIHKHNENSQSIISVQSVVQPNIDKIEKDTQTEEQRNCEIQDTEYINIKSPQNVTHELFIIKDEATQPNIVQLIEPPPAIIFEKEYPISQTIQPIPILTIQNDQNWTILPIQSIPNEQDQFQLTPNLQQGQQISECQYCNELKPSNEFNSGCLDKCLCDDCAMEMLLSDDYFGKCPFCDKILDAEFLSEIKVVQFKQQPFSSYIFLVQVAVCYKNIFKQIMEAFYDLLHVNFVQHYLIQNF